MESFRVALAQYIFKPGLNFESFSQHIDKHVDRAVEAKARILVFPEYLTFETLSPREFFKGKMNLKTLSQLYDEYLDLFIDLSVKYKLYLLAGTTPVEEEGKYFNTAHLFTPKKNLFKYRKIHLHRMDREMGFSSGSKTVTVETSPLKIGIEICYDLGFPELTRIYSLKGVELILAPSMAPGIGAYNWLRLCAHARAIETQGFVALSCGLYREEKLTFYGKSALLSTTDYKSKGFIEEGDEWKDETIIAEINLERYRRVKEITPAKTLRDLRPDVYKELCYRDWK